MRAFDRVLLSLTPWVGYLVLKLIGISQRTRFVNLRTVRRLHTRHPAVIFAVWHNRMMMIPYLYRRLFGPKTIVTLASSSRDGEYISRALRYFRPRLVRGSTSRGGSAAFRALIRSIDEGMDCIITPDGPRGPRCRVQAGTIALARLTGVPIVPMSYASSRRKVLSSWDRFILTLPFGRTTYAFGQPIICPRDASKEEMESLARRLEEAMLETSRRAEADLSRSPARGRTP